MTYTDSMKIPRIIYQTNERWAVVYKPLGWSLGSRGSSSLGSVESFLAPVLRGSSKLFFPFELDTKMSGLSIICCDRGMQSQFERFRIKREIEFKFLVHTSFPPNLNGQRPGISANIITDAEGRSDIEVTTSEYLPVRTLESLIGVSPLFGIQLYSLEFPDPFKPSSDVITISIPPDTPDMPQ